MYQLKSFSLLMNLPVTFKPNFDCEFLSVFRFQLPEYLGLDSLCSLINSMVSLVTDYFSSKWYLISCFIFFKWPRLTCVSILSKTSTALWKKRKTRKFHINNKGILTGGGRTRPVWVLFLQVLRQRLWQSNFLLPAAHHPQINK